jgi:8-oxo-dGTP pyrophosphatase MutT (NUDIX family)
MTSWRIKLEPVLTPIFRTWWRVSRSMTLGVRALVVDAQSRVLLVRHSYTPGWHFPGGGVEKRESAVEAVTRELAEEAGVAPESTPVLIGFYANHINFPNDHIALYRVDRWRDCAAAATGEIAEHGFFALDALPEGVTPATRRRLAEMFEGAPQSATW